jgi:AcrR family transcriptional regulator
LIPACEDGYELEHFRKDDHLKSPGKDRSHEPMSVRWKRMTEAEKKRRIVDAVLDLIDKHGVQGATTARIAAAVGVSEPTLYRTFRNKREILLDTADAAWQARLDNLNAAKALDASDAVEHLRNIGEYHTKGIQTSRVVQWVWELAVAPPSLGLRKRLQKQQLADLQYLIEVIEEGKNEGSIRKDVDSKDAAWRIMAFYWLEAASCMLDLEQVVLSGPSTMVLESILDGIAVPASSTSRDKAESHAGPAVAAGAAR